MIDLLALALATFATTLGFAKLALRLDARLLVVTTTLDLAKHTLAGHQPAKLTNRPFDTAIIHADFEGAALDGLVLALVIGLGGHGLVGGLFGVGRHAEARSNRGRGAGGQGFFPWAAGSFPGPRNARQA